MTERGGADWGVLGGDFSDAFRGGGSFLEGRRYSRRDCLWSRSLAGSCIDNTQCRWELTDKNLVEHSAHCIE